jgi:hypothetical protein
LHEQQVGGPCQEELARCAPAIDDPLGSDVVSALDLVERQTVGAANERVRSGSRLVEHVQVVERERERETYVRPRARVCTRFGSHPAPLRRREAACNLKFPPSSRAVCATT